MPATPSDEFIARVTKVIADSRKIPCDTVTLDKTFEELKIDSLDGINILFALETEFGIDIPDDDARKIQSVREAVDGAWALVAAKDARAEAPTTERGPETTGTA
jgi:acyl carrier protein